MKLEAISLLFSAAVVFALFHASVSTTLHDLLRALRLPLPSAAPAHTAAGAVTTPELYLALRWMSRTRAVPMRDWFLPPPQQQRLDDAGAVPGGLFPVHALYLYVTQLWVRLVAPDVDVRTAVTDAETQRRLLSVAAALPVGVVAFVGVPVARRIMASVSGLLLPAVVDRWAAHASAVDDGKASAAAAAAAVAANNIAIRRLVTFLGTLLLYFCALLPALVVEVSTLYPVCLATVFLLWAVLLLLRDEEALHPTTTRTKDDFDLCTPSVVQGSVRCFPLKASPPKRYLVGASALLTLSALSTAAFLYVAPLLAVWFFTSCYQHCHRIVYVQSHQRRAGPGYSGEPDVVDIGFSRYRDLRLLNTWLSFVSMTMLCVVAAACAPFCVGRQSFFAFVRLLSRDAVEWTDTAPATTAARSISGALEMAPVCLRWTANATSASAFHHCARPGPSSWLLLEHAGVPTTSLFRRFSMFFTPSSRQSEGEAHLWAMYAAVVMLIGYCCLPALSLMGYRLRAPLLAFETAVQQRQARVQHQRETDDYWRQKALLKGAPPPCPPRGNGSHATATAPSSPSRARVISTVTRDEYVLKQLLALTWLLLAGAGAAALLMVRTDVLHVASLLAPAGLLLGYTGCGAAMRRWAPPPFDAYRAEERQMRIARATREEELTHDAGAARRTTPSTAEPRWMQSSSLWCSSAPLAERADGCWLTACLLAVLWCVAPTMWGVLPAAVCEALWLPAAAALAVCLVFSKGVTRRDAGVLLLAVLLLAGVVHAMEVWRRCRGGDLECLHRALVVRSALSSLCIGGAAVHAVVRLCKLSLDADEERLVPIDEEMAQLSERMSAGSAKKK